MIRVTTNGTLYNYKSSFNQTANQLNSAMMKLMTGRNFDTYAANPAGATRAFQIHSSINATNAQYDNNQTVLSKFETAWSSIQGVLDGFDGLATDSRLSALSGLNDTNLSTLNTQGQLIRESAEGIIQSLNAKYGDDFMFAGADTQNAPFSITTGADGRSYVTYRGIQIDNADTLDDDYLVNGQPVYVNDDGSTMSNKEVLDMWNQEHQYVDIGLGFELDGNGVIPSTAFDSAISGLELTGYGLDGDGDPLNLVSTMLRLADVFEDYNEETGEWGAAGDREDAERLLKKVCRAVVPCGERTLLFIDFQGNLVSHFQHTARNMAYMADLSSQELDGVLHLEHAVLCADHAIVRLLAAACSVERSLIYKHGAFLAVRECVHDFILCSEDCDLRAVC